MKIQIKSWLNGSVLFEHEQDGNTLKITFMEAVKSRADLYGANLSGADLYGADLYCADLYGANLSRANLYGANLSRADLSGADLYCADLSRANLSRADLSGANLSRADLSGANLSRAAIDGHKVKDAAMFNGLYKYHVIPMICEDGINRIRMGCFLRTAEEWDNDFWNNPNEFPNNGTVESELRYYAYQFAKKWIEIKSR